jgi:molybdopterin/thiamine biosynthesis adenylyltransferase
MIRLIMTHGIKSVVVVDGDRYEEGQHTRQDSTHLNVGEYKAVVLARKINASFGGEDITVRPITRYLSERRNSEDAVPVKDVIQDGDLVISCVDNHAARLVISQHAQRLENVIMISCGNDLYTGNAYCYARQDKRDLTNPVESVHLEVASGGQRNPADMSCEERAALPGGAQTIAANVMASALAVVLVSRILKVFQVGGRSQAREVLWNTEIQFDNSRCSAVPHTSLKN